MSSSFSAKEDSRTFKAKYKHLTGSPRVFFKLTIYVGLGLAITSEIMFKMVHVKTPLRGDKIQRRKERAAGRLVWLQVDQGTIIKVTDKRFPNRWCPNGA